MSKGKDKEDERSRCDKCGCPLLPWMVEVQSSYLGKLSFYRPCVECGNKVVEKKEDYPFEGEDWGGL